MTRPEPILIRGQLHLTLQTVAECYDVQVHWLEEVYDEGLLAGEEFESRVAVAATELDRIARIVRLHFYEGVSLPGIASLLRYEPF
jgi:hypothetical protein